MVKRIAIVTVMVCVGLTLASGQEPFVAPAEADLYTSLPRSKAVEAAKDLAARDFTAGRLRILIMSKSIWSPSYEDYLRDHYGIQIMFLSIRQPEKALAVTTAYNKSMDSLLEKKFHKDIFKEAKEATGQKW